MQGDHDRCEALPKDHEDAHVEALADTGTGQHARCRDYFSHSFCVVSTRTIVCWGKGKMQKMRLMLPHQAYFIPCNLSSALFPDIWSKERFLYLQLC